MGIEEDPSLASAGSAWPGTVLGLGVTLRGGELCSDAASVGDPSGAARSGSASIASLREARVAASAARAVALGFGLSQGEVKWKLVATVLLEAKELGPKKSNMLVEPSDDLARVWEGRRSCPLEDEEL